MRISTVAMQRLAINSILNQQSELSRTQLQLATGNRIINPSDDPLGTQRIMELDATLERIGQFRENGELARVRLSLEDNALANATDIIQRARELVVQGSNDTYTAQSRGLIATEIRQLADSLLETANSQNGQGEYLFSGFRSRTEAFTRGSSGVVYNGDQGQRQLRVSESQQVADGDPGSRVFLEVPTGNGTFAVAASSTNAGGGVILPGAVVDPAAYDGDDYRIQFTAPDAFDIVDSSGAIIQSGTFTEGETIAFRGIQVRIEGLPDPGDTFDVNPSSYQDMFATLDAIATALENTGETAVARAQTRTALNAGLANLDQSIDRLVQMRTEVGSRLTMLDTQDRANDEYQLQLETTRSDIRDLDFAEAVGRLNLQLTGLQAAQQTYTRVQGLSLFNFL
jgi:flagellar hook-associated protein 3 FlgL